MIVELYKNNSSDNALEKTLTNKKSLNGTLKDDFNLLNPNLTITLNQSDFLNFNYCYIPKLKRYYFIDDITILSNNRLYLSLNIDVLMTYKDLIKLQSGVLKETENNSLQNNSDYIENDKIELVNSYDLENVFDTHTDCLISIIGK